MSSEEVSWVICSSLTIRRAWKWTPPPPRLHLSLADCNLVFRESHVGENIRRKGDSKTEGLFPRWMGKNVLIRAECMFWRLAWHEGFGVWSPGRALTSTLWEKFFFWWWICGCWTRNWLELKRWCESMKLKVEVCCKRALITFSFTPQITCVCLWGLTNTSSVFQCFKHCIASTLTLQLFSSLSLLAHWSISWCVTASCWSVE